MANTAASVVLRSLYAGQSPSDVDGQTLELILKLMAATGGNDELASAPAEVVRRATALVGRSLAVQRLESTLNTLAEKQARGQA